MVVLPTFLIPGAGKSGTSYVAYVLGQHPEVFVTAIKEPAFFSTFPGRGFYHKGMSFYQKHFRGYSGQKHIGEASTVYMYDPESPKLIQRHLGAIKFIFIIRNPTDRTYSNYWQEIKGGRVLPEFYSFITSGGERAEEMLYVSKYDIHLKRYFSIFGVQNCLVKTYDQLQEDPWALFKDITDFLNIEGISPSIDVRIRVNQSARPRVNWLARRLRDRNFVQNLKDSLPAQLVGPAKRLGDRVKRLNEKPEAYPPMAARARHFLADEFRPTVEYVGQELGLQVKGWLQGEGKGEIG